ncbi:TrkA C-terminal domain-containing protein [Botrimarina hoheduenensis]|nr:TrkA C-terminal domain-containing protein [Botrimarina hoheduenensis]
MSTTGASVTQRTITLALLAAGLLLLWLIFNSRWIERHMNRVIAWTLKKFTDLDVRDYVALLELSNGYAVSEMLVESTDWLAGKCLADLWLSDEGILVLGIRSSAGAFHGSPRGGDIVSASDTLILYGDLENIEELDRRRAGRAGDKEHSHAVEEQGELEETL